MTTSDQRADVEASALAEACLGALEHKGEAAPMVSVLLDDQLLFGALLIFSDSTVEKQLTMGLLGATLQTADTLLLCVDIFVKALPPGVTRPEVRPSEDPTASDALMLLEARRGPQEGDLLVRQAIHPYGRQDDGTLVLGHPGEATLAELGGPMMDAIAIGLWGPRIPVDNALAALADLGHVLYGPA